MGDSLLINGDSGRQALDVLHIRLVHPAQELAGICRQRLDISALALRVDGVERQRTLARARHTSNYYQLIARDSNVDVFEVVLARSANHDVLEGHILRASSGRGLGMRIAPSGGRHRNLDSTTSRARV